MRGYSIPTLGDTWHGLCRRACAGEMRRRLAALDPGWVYGGSRLSDRARRVLATSIKGRWLPIERLRANGPSPPRGPREPRTDQALPERPRNPRHAIWAATPRRRDRPDVAGPGSNQPQGSITISGRAADAVGVTAVDNGIQNTSTGRWLQPNGSWGSSYVALPATLVFGSTIRTWTLPWSAIVGSFMVRRDGPRCGGERGRDACHDDVHGSLAGRVRRRRAAHAPSFRMCSDLRRYPLSRVV